MASERPVNLSVPGLFRAMPVMAVVSILHRFTGIVLFAGAFYLCYLLDLALADQAGFRAASAIATSTLGKLALLAVLAALAYHVLAGLKHLLLDFHVGDTPGAARMGSWVTILLALILAVLAALWLW